MPEINEKKQTDFAIDTLASMVIYELSEELGKSVEDIFNEFYSSKHVKFFTMSQPSYGGMGHLILLICIKKN